MGEDDVIFENCGEIPESEIFDCEDCSNYLCDTCAFVCRNCGNFLCESCYQDHKKNCK